MLGVAVGQDGGETGLGEVEGVRFEVCSECAESANGYESELNLVWQVSAGVWQYGGELQALVRGMQCVACDDALCLLADVRRENARQCPTV